MTLGIGLLCEKGEAIVMASEQRATYDAGKLAPNDECGKQFHLKPLKCFVNVAGRMSTCHAVYSQFAHLVQNGIKDHSNIPPELMMALIDDARFRELRRTYNWTLKRYMGLTLHQWATGKLKNAAMSKYIVDAGLRILEMTPFKCELIVGGFVGEHGMFFRAAQKLQLEEETSPGVYCIGTGQRKAMEHLNKRGQNLHMSLARSLLHVYEAMLCAQSQYVGPPPQMVAVLRKRDDRLLKYPLTSLEDWRKSYEGISTASLDASSVAGKTVLARLKTLDKPETGF